ncbi:MAG: 50S ribosomal protein L3 [Propionibacteriales bacterium]|nr:MAG: 50S ribosomal protein L3 [Propionibacteriales bacterium]
MSFERKVKGLLGTKLGMTQLWDENNKVVPITVIQAGPCVVTQVKTPDTKDAYPAIQLGFGAIKSKAVTKPMSGHFDRAGVTPRKHVLRHGFAGLRASHGVHRKHRAPGSIGGCATPGRVFKGLRMAGRMGNDKVTVQNLKIHAVDAERGLILVRGAIPGNKGSLVVVRSAAKKGDVA